MCEREGRDLFRGIPASSQQPGEELTTINISGIISGLLGVIVEGSPGG